MKHYYIEYFTWSPTSGTYFCLVMATSHDEAKRKFELEHGSQRTCVSIQEA